MLSDRDTSSLMVQQFALYGMDLTHASDDGELGLPPPPLLVTSTGSVAGSAGRNSRSKSRIQLKLS